jgi:Flp pilus assembly secretin CpaC
MVHDGTLGDLLIPPLFNLIGERDAPIVIRVSTLSILAQCVDVNPQAVTAYCGSIRRAMLDLLEIESLHAQKQYSESKKNITIPDDQPVTTDPKVAEFRRAALHLLGVLLRDTVRQKYAAEEKVQRSALQGPAVSITRAPHDQTVELLDQDSMRRIDSVLGYVSATDVDSVVRFMAQELLELMHS